MKRFTSTESGALILAALLFVGGLVWMLWPQEMVVFHATNDAIGSPESYMEFVTKTGSRIYAIIAMLVGAGIAALAIYRGKT